MINTRSFTAIDRKNDTSPCPFVSETNQQQLLRKMSCRASASLSTVPVELVYRILDHLSPIEVFLSARNVCQRLDSITDTYHRYKVGSASSCSSHVDYLWSTTRHLRVWRNQSSYWVLYIRSTDISIRLLFHDERDCLLILVSVTTNSGRRTQFISNFCIIFQYPISVGKPFTIDSDSKETAM